MPLELNLNSSHTMKKAKYIAGLVTVTATTWLNAQINPGANNIVGGTNSSVAGGDFNSCTPLYGIVGAGARNTNTAYCATIGGGWRNKAVTDYSTIPGGKGARTRSVGQLAYGSGTFSGVWGEAQFGLYVLRGSIAGTGTVELALDGNTEHILVPTDASFLFDIDTVCRSTSVANGVAGNCFHAKLLVENINGALNLQELANTSILNHSTNLTATYFVTNSNFKISGTGEANNTVYWVATVRATELVKP